MLLKGIDVKTLSWLFSESRDFTTLLASVSTNLTFPLTMPRHLPSYLTSSSGLRTDNPDGRIISSFFCIALSGKTLFKNLFFVFFINDTSQPHTLLHIGWLFSYISVATIRLEKKCDGRDSNPGNDLFAFPVFRRRFSQQRKGSWQGRVIPLDHRRMTFFFKEGQSRN